MAGRPNDPYTNNRFLVEIDKIANIEFAEVILPEAHVEVIDYREGGDKASIPRRLIGPADLTHLVLRRGLSQSNDLFTWWQNISSGIADRRNVAVTLLDDEQTVVKRWVMTNAWPCRYLVSPLISLGEAAVLIETIECAVEQFEVA